MKRKLINCKQETGDYDEEENNNLQSENYQEVVDNMSMEPSMSNNMVSKGCNMRRGVLVQHRHVNGASSQEMASASYKQFGRVYETTLLDAMKRTVIHGVFDSVLATSTVMKYRDDGRFVQSDYETFISMLPSLGFRTFEADVFPRQGMSMPFLYVTNKIRADATAALCCKQEKSIDVVKRHVATELQLKDSGDLKFYPTSLSSNLLIEQNGDFKNVVLADLMNTWPGNGSPDNFKKINSAVRFVLGEITTVPEDIQKYCPSATRQGALLPLPIEIVSVMKKFVLQLAQLHHNIFDYSVDDAASDPNFLEKFTEFGTDEKARRTSFRRQQLLRSRLVCEFPNILKEAFHHMRRCICKLRGTGVVQQRVWTRK